MSTPKRIYVEESWEDLDIASEQQYEKSDVEYIRHDLYSQAVSAVEEKLKKAHELLDKSYDAIMTAISAEDGLDGQAGVDLANEIRDVIPDGSFVKGWNDPELPEV